MHRRFLVANLVACGLALAACHNEGNENLGLGDPTAQAIDVAKLTNPAELLRAVSVGGAPLDAALGPHRMQASSSLKLELPGQKAEQLDETFDVAFDGKSLRLRHENEQDYGFEAISTGNRLWVKPRYGKYVLRKIEGDELERLRKTAELPAAAWLRLFLPSLQVAEAGRAQVAGRAGVKLTLSAKPTAGAPLPTTEPGKAWRRTVQVKYLSGDVIVDAKTGVPLAVRLDAGFSFEREGKPLNATVAFKQTTMAEPGAIEAPTDFVTLTRPRPMLDRQQLLEGLVGNK
jgi:hypothetical protein